MRTWVTIFGLHNPVFCMRRSPGLNNLICQVSGQLLERRRSIIHGKVYGIRTNSGSHAIIRRTVGVDLKIMVFLNKHHRIKTMRSLGSRRTSASLVNYGSGDAEVSPRGDEIRASIEAEIDSRGSSQGQPSAPSLTWNRRRRC